MQTYKTLTGRVARLEEQRVDEQVEKDGVAGRDGGVGTSLGVPPVLANKWCIHIVKHVGPHLTDV
jgi:hypothetical protein